ncbi:MAG TPA: hypothetical protein VHE30_12320 [Polyangiaceae bacterium]|nr:hypothetical protein [Polyangiaceae bacterium]
MKSLVCGGLGVALALGAPAAEARGRALEAVTLGSEKVRIDGLLREWPAKMDSLGDVVQGSAAGDPNATGVIGYNEANVFVAMKIRDQKLVRTSSFGDHEDYASLEIAFPTNRGFSSHQVRLYAGEIGKSAGAVKMDGSPVKGARIVEAPSDGGYTIECQIPWALFPEASRIRAGLRAALRYTDVDSGGSVKAIIGTSSGNGSSLPPLLLEAEQGLYRTLVRGKGISDTPSRFAVGDIAGDSQLEAVGVYGSALTIVGAGYRGGKEFFFQDLQVPEASAVTRLEVMDMTGDGKDDILVGKRVGTKDEYREVIQVLRVSSGDSPYVAFQQETGIVTKKGEIHNEVALKKKGDKVDIVLSQGKAEGFDPTTYDEPLPGDMDSALLPWQTLKSRTFEWDGKTFSDAGSESWTPTMKAPEHTTTKATAVEAGPPPPPPPRPPSPDELLDRVYALYRKDRSVGIEKPRFDFVTDVAGDRTPERVLIHGKDIVVFGKAFKEGTSYAFITIGVESPKDVLDVTARDLTGDGKAEILVRGVLHAKASKEMGGKTVDRHGFFVYQATEGGIKRVFAAETGRSLGDDSIVAGLRFVPKGKGTLLELTPGRAVGWTEKTYPFPVDRYPYGGLEALLVPWGDVPVKRYRFDGNAFVSE